MKYTKLCAAIALLLTVLCLAALCAADTEYVMPVKDGDLSVYPGLDPDVKNILLIGTDTEENTIAGRADTIMICSVNPDTGMVRITSLARDTWVTMGDSGRKHKLNAAHQYGGPELLMQTINRTYRMNIEDYVSVNFYGICDIVDTLGGVTIQLEKDEPWAINTTTDESYAGSEDTPIYRIERDATEARLCGVQALAYARIRKLDNDLGRQARQRKLLMAMLEEVRGCTIPQMISLAGDCFRHVSTNLSLPEIISLAVGMMNAGFSDIRMQEFPGKGEYKYGGGNGISWLIVDTEYGAEKIHRFIYSEYLPEQDVSDLGFSGAGASGSGASG